jgi:hypothetical protein
MARRTRDEEFSEYVVQRRTQLRRIAYLLCGDVHKAEDLVQTALMKLYVAWPRVQGAGSVDAYARRILVNSGIDESRRPWRREESGLDGLDPTVVEGTALEDRSVVMDALASLPLGQRRVGGPAAHPRHVCRGDSGRPDSMIVFSVGAVLGCHPRGRINPAPVPRMVRTGTHARTVSPVHPYGASASLARATGGSYRGTLRRQSSRLGPGSHDPSISPRMAAAKRVRASRASAAQTAFGQSVSGWPSAPARRARDAVRCALIACAAPASSRRVTASSTRSCSRMVSSAIPIV